MQPQNFEPPAPQPGLQPPPAMPGPAAPPPMPPGGNPDPQPTPSDPYHFILSQPGPAPVPPAKRKRGWLIAGGIVLAVVVVGAAVVALLGGGDSQPPASRNGSTQHQTSGDTQSTAHARYYYTHIDSKTQNPTLFLVDPTANTTAKQTLQFNEKYEDGNEYETFAPGKAGTNQPLQLSADGAILAYATVEVMDSGQTNLADSSAILADSFRLFAGKRTGQHQTLVAGKSDSAILDWKLSADGTEVFYLEARADQRAQLYSVNVATGQDKDLGSVAFDASRSHSALSEIDAEKAVRFYSAMQDGIYQTSYSRTAGTIERTFVASSSQYVAGSFGPLSPDGKHLLYTGDNGSNAFVYRIGTADGEVQTIFDPIDSRTAFIPTGWSADSKKIALVTTPYDDAGAAQTDFSYRIVSYNVATNEQALLAETAGLGTSQTRAYEHAMWSPDASHVNFVQDETLRFLAVATTKLLAQPKVSVDQTFGLARTSYGWIAAEDNS